MIASYSCPNSRAEPRALLCLDFSLPYPVQLSMDPLPLGGDEISSKIRLAIKAKLQELLDSNVDDELPDYVMVMVANKRGDDALRSDLGLFLGDSTEEFVQWLLGVLHRLEKVTVGE